MPNTMSTRRVGRAEKLVITPPMMPPLGTITSLLSGVVRIVVKILILSTVPMAPPEVLHGVNFEFDSARLTPNAKTVLRGVAERLLAHSDTEVEIAGHTDSKGSDEYNQALSERRAESVRDFLIDLGVDPGRLQARGYGDTRPVDSNASDEGRERNRRIEMRRIN